MCMKGMCSLKKGRAEICDVTNCSLVLAVLFQITVCAEQIVRELEPPEKTKSLATVQQTRRQKMQQQR